MMNARSRDVIERSESKLLRAEFGAHITKMQIQKSGVECKQKSGVECKQKSGVECVPDEAVDASFAVLQIVKLVATICDAIEDESNECNSAKNDE
jgi:hypothetical protein